jgi:mRNA degradation ribonuclease J1/J2
MALSWTSTARTSARGARGDISSRPFKLERIHLTHSIPDSSGVAITTDLGTILFTGDYKFDQTPVGGAPADMARLAELGKEGVLLLCGDSTNVDRAGVSDSESIVGPHLDRVFARCPGRIVVTCFASNIHRVQQVVTRPGPTPARSRSSGARCARTSTSAAASGTSTCPRACSSRRARSTSGRTRRSS